MEEMLTFDDVLIKPQFSDVGSRKDVDLSTKLGSLELKLPILSANMDTVTESDMAIAMHKAGGAGVLHRFMSIEDGINHLVKCSINSQTLPPFSVGLGEYELKRVKELYQCGSKVIVIDVAHGAQEQVANQYKKIQELCPDAYLIVGNFASAETIEDFVADCGYLYLKDFEGAIKVGIGGGSVCQTRAITGVGIPQLSAIQDCVKTGLTIISDGGHRNPGDIAKALGAGASAVMLGGMLAGTDETPGKVIFEPTRPFSYSRELQILSRAFPEFVDYDGGVNKFKKYSGSASKEAYETQGKESSWRAPEGITTTIPYKGPVANILQEIEGGLRSAFTYVGARNLEEFQLNVRFIRVTGAGFVEGTPHARR